MRLLFWRKPKLEPNLEAFNKALIYSVYGRNYDGHDVAGDFRLLFNREPALGQRVLFMLLTWCGEYDGPPDDNDALQRWAGKREVAGRIKAAMHAALPPTREEETEENVREN